MRRCARDSVEWRCDTRLPPQIGFPVALNSTPRLLWALAWLGSMAIARRYASIAASSLPVRLEDDAKVAVAIRLIRR